MKALLLTGKLPNRSCESLAKTITVTREPEKMASAIKEPLGRE